MSEILPFFLQILIDIDLMVVSLLKVFFVDRTAMGIGSIKCAFGQDLVG